MKKRQIVGMIAAAALLAGAHGISAAAEWREGLGPAKPYEGVPELNLEETMGYTMLFPRANMPASNFCDVLELYLPREDIVRGEGKIQLYDENGLVCESSFADPEQIEIRPLDEQELKGLMWGGGTCVCAHLPVSLSMGGSYYVHMDAGCFSAADGKVTSLAIAKNDAWVPVLNGDFGINALSYREGGAEKLEPSTEIEEPKEAAEGSEEKKEEEKKEGPDFSEFPVTLTPHAGDALTFSLVLGGDAASAVVYSEDNSVLFDETEYTESAQVNGRIVNDKITWGMVFLDANGNVLHIVSVKKG